MKAIVGLGNPGEKYAHTRHNAGFDTLDLLALRLETPIRKLKCHAVYGEATVAGERIVLIKPQTFMNLSGMTVSEALNWFKLTPEDMLLIVDDIDLPFGQVRVRAKGGPGTHNGLRSIRMRRGRRLSAPTSWRRTPPCAGRNTGSTSR